MLVNERDEPPGSGKDKDGAAEENRRRHTILICDDDKTLRRIVSTNLELAGFSVIAVGDGNALLDTLDVILPDLVILDVMMVGLDGYEITRKIREHPAAAHIPIIMLTARGETEEMVRGFDAGADDYVVKPFGPAELLARVRAKIRRVTADAALQPLTRLPGNVAIENEIQRRLDSKLPWAVLYIDMDNFKAFNDVYGFVHGDEAIVLLARTLSEVSRRVGGNGDFVGHIGGDDFIVVTTPARAQGIADETIRVFDREIHHLYTDEDAQRGYIVTADRRGNVKSFPIMTISIAIVASDRRRILTYGEIGEVAAELKAYAKAQSGSVVVADKRR